MDTLVGTLYGVVALWAEIGAQMGRYPLVLVLGAVSLVFSLVVFAWFALASILRRSLGPWPWRAHLAGLLLLLGATAMVHLDARIARSTGLVKQLGFDALMEAIRSEGDRFAVSRQNHLQLIDAAATRARIAGLFPRCDLEVVALDQAVEFAYLRVREPPYCMVYAAVIDLTDPSISIEITDAMGDKTLTSAFAAERDCIVAINGEAGVSPALDAPLGRYTGAWVSDGVAVLRDEVSRRPFLAFDRQNRARYMPGGEPATDTGPEMHNALWGRGTALRDGALAVNEKERWMRINPRTLMGIDARGERLVLLVVDGRQPNYSLGLELDDAASVLLAFGASDGIWCDQGGSSTMALGLLGGIVNQPSDGFERPVYAHFGIARTEPQASSSGGVSGSQPEQSGQSGQSGQPGDR